MDFLRKWQIWLPIVLTCVVGMLNVAGYHIAMPVSFALPALIAWAIGIILSFIPTLAVGGIGAGILVSYHKRTIAGLKANQAQFTADLAYFEALKAGKIPVKKIDKKPFGATGTVPSYTFTVADIDTILQAVNKGVLADNLDANPILVAERFYDAIAAYDLRPVSRETRLPVAKALMQKVMDLDTDAWQKKVGIPVLPTSEQCAQRTRYMYQFKKDYEKAQNLNCACGDIDYGMINNLLGYFSNAYEALFGLDKLAGVTVDWSTFADSQYSAQMVGWYYAELII